MSQETSAAAPPPARAPSPGAVCLVTSADQPGLGTDDQLLHDALIAAGVPVRITVWTDPFIDWSAASACVIRSVWDYHLQPQRFRSWLRATASRTVLLNPPELVAWNMHKQYLRELAHQGIPTIDTAWLPAGSRADLKAVLRARRWHTAIVKPAVSASAWKTAKVHLGEARGQALVDQLLPLTDVMVQPYLDTIEQHGEVSVIAVDGEVTHAARRASALTGDIETTRLGKAHAIADDERALANQVLATLPSLPRAWATQARRARTHRTRAVPTART
jgi:hypothetical protein